MNQPLFALLLLLIYYVFAFLYDKKRSNSIVINQAPKEAKIVPHNIPNDFAITTNNISQITFGSIAKEVKETIKIMEFEDFNSEGERYAYLNNINLVKHLGLEDDQLDMASKTPMEFDDIVNHLN
jgi:hypothetical protein